MLPVIVLPYLINLLSVFYFLPTLILTIYYIYLCGTLLKSKSKNDNNLLARKIFLYSIFYLFSVFLLILIDNILMRFYG